MSWSAADYAFMARALQLARRGMYSTTPNPRVGAVLVRNNRIVGEGWHERAGGPHAEVVALAGAREAARGTVCYVTLEPCAHAGRTPPCTSALIEAGVARVVAAMPDPNPLVSGRGMEILDAAGIATDSGLLQPEAAALNRGFVMRMTAGRPFVRCKMGVSLDFATEVGAGSGQWITGEEARADVQRLRAESCAILTGSGTVLADDPRLNVRLDGLGGRQPLRVILDRRLRFPANAGMLRLPGRTLLFTESRDEARHRELIQAGAEIVVLDARAEEFPAAVLHYLAEREQVNEVLVEAGATLAGSLLTLKLVDELVIYQAPILLGARATGSFHRSQLPGIQDRIVMRLVENRAVGRDRRLIFRPERDSE